MNATMADRYVSMRCTRCDGVRWKGLHVLCFVCGLPGVRGAPTSIVSGHSWRAPGV